MVMTAAMADAESEVQPSRPGQYRQFVYAGDALLMARTVDDIQRCLEAVCQSASNVGLEMHQGKLQLSRVRCTNGMVRAPTGEVVEATDALPNLGTTSSCDGRA
eukprot:9494437-Pyramimonas_sp.AAC.1